MATLVKQWPTGTGNLSVTYEGSGDGTAVFASDTNEGIDRVMDVAFKAGDIVEQRIVTQEGLRQPFGLSGGGVFRIKGGGRYGVLKVGEPVEPPTPPAPANEYSRLSWIECTGAQYINTSYIVQEDDIIEMQFTKPVRTTVAEYFFGASDSAGNSVSAYVNSNSIYPRFGYDSNVTLSSTRWKNILTMQRGSISVDNTTATLVFEAMPQVPLYIFANNKNGSATTFATIRSTGFTITKASGELVMKLRPCMRNADGAIGMIDVVSGQFFENLGSADFLHGGEARTPAGYEIIDYLTCTKDKVFDTGVYANETTYVDVLFRRTNTDAAEYLYGATSTSSRRFTAYLTSSGYWRYGSSSTTFNTKDMLLHFAEVTPGKITIDNTSKTFTASEFASPFSIPVGGYTPASGEPVADYQGHIYYFRMRHGEEIVVDYIPCKRLADGVEGFWDCINQTFVEPIN